MSPKSKAEAIKKQLVVFNELLKKPENKYCADCKKTTPTWASVNLGVFVCINCSGCHREIGVHITKIRSTNLDVWPKDILNNFKLINNQIANKYWECKLKNFDFKKIQNDKYKLVEFIRNKYEYKKWVDPNKKMDPMTLIMKGKIKKYKSLYCPSEGEEEEEEENEKKINKTKKIKKDKNIKNAKSDDDEEEEDDNQDSSDKNENNNNKVINNIDNNNKINENNLQQHDSKNKNEDMLLDLNMNNNDMNNFNSQQNLLNLNNNTKNNDIMDLFNSGNNQNNMNKNINTYFSPQPMRPGGIDNIFQQMPNNTKLNLQKNNINFGFTNNNNMFNNGNNSNNLQNMNNMNNNNMFNINYGLNNNFNNMNNNLNNLNNFNFNNNLSNNNINNKDNKNLQNNNNLSGTIPNKKIEFNMEYFNKNMETKKSNTGSTYNFKKKKEDPFANLVSFKK